MKRIIALLLVVATMFAFTACKPNGKSKKAKGELVVGSVTDLNGDMMNGWSNGGQNKSLKNLINGYDTFEFAKDGTFHLNKVAVKQCDITDDEVGKTYTYTLNENLKWNNGKKITAKDYVFNAMLYSCPEFHELDEADNTAGTDIYGFADFNSGKTKTFKGVRLLGEYKFSITVPKDRFPYFYQDTYFVSAPLPLEVLAPGVDITDNGEGATWSDNFSVDVIREPITNTKTGYRYNPKVTCGPYNFVSYDEGSKQAVLEANPEFLGREDGAKATIQKLILKTVTPQTEMDELSTGVVGLLQGVSGGEEIEAGLKIADEGKANFTSYDRSGYGMITFACDFGPTQFTSVRQAIAYCLDRKSFADQYTGGYGKVMDAAYAPSQWEYKKNKEALEKELNHYPHDLAKAEEVLVNDGWTLNKNGKPFVKGTDDIRYKKVGNELMPLVIEWASPDASPVSALISTMLPSEAAKVGMKINQTPMDFPLVLNNLYRQGIDKPQYHMFNLANGFAEVNACWYYVSTDPQYFGLYNQERIVDKEIESIANDMKKTDPKDKDGWAAKWLKYQKRYNELVINLPLYSDEYHEFFTPKLKNYTPEGLWSWEHAILRAELED